MMVEQAEAYIPRHMKAESTDEVDRARLRELAQQLPDGMVLSVDLQEVITDGQEDG